MSVSSVLFVVLVVGFVFAVTFCAEALAFRQADTSEEPATKTEGLRGCLVILVVVFVAVGSILWLLSGM